MFISPDFVDLAGKILGVLEDKATSAYTGVDGDFLVGRLNSLCCELAVTEGATRLGISVKNVRDFVRELILGRESLYHHNTDDYACSEGVGKLAKLTAEESSPLFTRLEGLGCELQGNGSLTFHIVSSRHPPHWIEALLGRDLPTVAIVNPNVSNKHGLGMEIIIYFGRISQPCQGWRLCRGAFAPVAPVQN